MKLLKEKKDKGNILLLQTNDKYKVFNLEGNQLLANALPIYSFIFTLLIN